MKSVFLRICLTLKQSLILVLFSTLSLSYAQNHKNKSKLNTQVFEAEGDNNSFSGKVRILRDQSGDTEVFFEDKKMPGPFTLSEKLPSYGLFKSRLQKSKKTGGPKVKVTIDNDHITSVDIEEGAGTETINEKDLINSVFKK